MTAPIPPALTPAEWAEGAVARGGLEASLWRTPGGGHLTIGNSDADTTSHHDGPAELAAIVALANDARPDDDPGKLTRAGVALLHRALAANTPVLSDPPRMAEPPLTFGEQMRLRALADALESILPPEPA